MSISERHIVAIDLGSSKIALTVAKVNGEDVQIIYYKETPSAGIRYSCVFQEASTTQTLSTAIAMAEEELGIKITSAVVGMPKYPIIQHSNTAKMDGRGYDCDITTEDIDELKKLATELYPLQDERREAVYGAVAQSFSNGDDFQFLENEIIGTTGDVLEGNFKIFIGNKNYLNKIDHVMNRLGIPAIRKYFTADSTAKIALTETEMEHGVALIDFGGGCTSVSIYHGNIMRHYAAIPFGGKNISNDIKTECQINDSLAENIKLGFGACMPEKLHNLGEKTIHIRSKSGDPDKQLPVKYLSEIITARTEEIVMAILYEIEHSGFAEKIKCGIVITGGSAQLANLCNFITDLSGYKVRTGYPKFLFSSQGFDTLAEPSATTSLGLILKAKEDTTINCAISNDYIGADPGTVQVISSTGSEETENGCSNSNETGSLFADEEEQLETPETEKSVSQTNADPETGLPKNDEQKESAENNTTEKKKKTTWGTRMKNIVFKWYDSTHDESSEA